MGSIDGLRIVFDPALDGAGWPGPLDGRTAVFGEAWLGPLGLLARLESELGLVTLPITAVTGVFRAKRTVTIEVETPPMLEGVLGVRDEAEGAMNCIGDVTNADGLDRTMAMPQTEKDHG